MTLVPPSPNQSVLYWRQLEQLKAVCICMRLYRNALGRWVRGVEIIKAVASSGGIAGWVVWKDYPLVWAGIIAAAQLLDAFKNVIPFAKTHRAASDLTITLEIVYIDAEDDWESIHAGKLSEAAINSRRTRLRNLQLDAEPKHFPDGFEPSERLIRLATEEARAHFSLTFIEESP
jgi:hypothetical protein